MNHPTKCDEMSKQKAFIYSQYFDVFDVSRKAISLYTGLVCGAVDDYLSGRSPMSFEVEELFFNLIRDVLGGFDE